MFAQNTLYESPPQKEGDGQEMFREWGRTFMS
jgi:hypothetical protein